MVVQKGSDALLPVAEGLLSVVGGCALALFETHLNLNKPVVP